MILFSPMWQHEIERLGWRRCSPAGYVLLNVSDGLSWLSLILWIAGLAGLVARPCLLWRIDVVVAAAAFCV